MRRSLRPVEACRSRAGTRLSSIWARFSSVRGAADAAVNRMRLRIGEAQKNDPSPDDTLGRNKWANSNRALMLSKPGSNPAGVAPLPNVAKFVNDSYDRICCHLSPL